MTQSRETTISFTSFPARMLAFVVDEPLLVAVVAAALIAAVWLATPALADRVLFGTGTSDRLLGTLSQPASTGDIETEATDDFRKGR